MLRPIKDKRQEEKAKVLKRKEHLREHNVEM